MIPIDRWMEKTRRNTTNKTTKLLSSQQSSSHITPITPPTPPTRLPAGGPNLPFTKKEKSRARRTKYTYISSQYTAVYIYIHHLLHIHAHGHATCWHVPHPYCCICTGMLYDTMMHTAVPAGEVYYCIIKYEVHSSSTHVRVVSLCCWHSHGGGVVLLVQFHTLFFCLSLWLLQLLRGWFSILTQQAPLPEQNLVRPRGHNPTKPDTNRP